MREQWQLLLDKINNFSLRERGLVLLSALAIIYLVWDFALFMPVSTTKADVQAELARSDQAIATMEQEKAIIQQSLNADPDHDLRMQLQDLEQRMMVLDANLSELSVGLVPVNKLATILQDVLGRTGSLQLHSLQTLPVEALELAIKTDADAANAGVYKHSVALTVKGSYMQLLDYLTSLEAMPWRFYWDELRYEREQYPSGLIQIRVYTLSTDEGLFGV